MVQSDLAVFYRLTKEVNEDEQAIKEAQKRLSANYDALVKLCPHSEAVDSLSKIRGMGTRRRCKICGITDYASEGGTSGDEYNYGYPGYPSESFWAGAEIEVVGEKDWNKYDRSHDWVVTDGKPRKRFE